jgi:hypothetical protein
MGDDYITRLGLIELPDEAASGYNDTVPAIDDEVAQPNKKPRRTRTTKASYKSDDETKKNGKRGRPRVDVPQDESVAEVSTWVPLTSSILML